MADATLITPFGKMTVYCLALSKLVFEANDFEVDGIAMRADFEFQWIRDRWILDRWSHHRKDRDFDKCRTMPRGPFDHDKWERLNALSDATHNKLRSVTMKAIRTWIDESDRRITALQWDDIKENLPAALEKLTTDFESFSVRDYRRGVARAIGDARLKTEYLRTMKLVERLTAQLRRFSTSPRRLTRFAA